MKMSDELDMQGRLQIKTFNRDDELITEVKANNFIVYTGRDLVAQLFLGQKIDPVRYLAVGTGNLAVNPVIDNKLQTEVFRKQIKAIDLSKDLSDTPEVTITKEGRDIKQKNRKVIISADLDFKEPGDQTYELKEAGLFNAAKDGGVMYNRVVFPVVTKTPDFKLTLVWEIIF
ncbi:hypothetical protein [Nostoc sp.]|uniref:hypothetical protein n=1 Tax=Nostoc sp. TaxID=1180 RepID=UPI002FF6E8BA